MAGGRSPTGGPPRERRTHVLVLNATTCAEVRALCERMRELFEGRAGPVVCDVAAVAQPDAGALEALARLQLAAIRLGRRLTFVNACDELERLLALTGLGDVLPCGGASPPPRGLGLQPLGEAEQREQALRVEEERDTRDPTA